MAILGALIDKTTVSRAGDAGTTSHRVGLTTLAHSLPATNPESVIMNLRSIEGALGIGGVHVRPFGLSGNASLTTIGYEYIPFPSTNSAVSTPTLMFDVLAIVYHSLIR